MGRSLKERQELAASLPWVTKLKKPTEQCDGVKWGLVSLTELITGNFKPSRGCKRRGWWRLKATKRGRSWESLAASGTYCWQHLAMQLDDHPAEHRRLVKFLKDHPEWDRDVS